MKLCSAICLTFFFWLHVIIAAGCVPSEKFSQGGSASDTDTDSDTDTAADTDSDADSDADSDVDSDVDSDDKNNDSDDNTKDPNGFVGTWAHIYYVDGTTMLPIDFYEVRADTKAAIYALIDIKKGDKDYIATFKYCDASYTMRSPSAFSLVIEVQKQTLSSLLKEEKTMSVGKNGEVYQPEYVDLLGLDRSKFGDVKNDPLPKNNSGFEDERVLDQDNDGNPGLTGILKGEIQQLFISDVKAKMYVVMRIVSTLNGQFDDEDTISGQIEWALDIVLLGSGPAGQNYVEIQPENQYPRPENQRFQMVRVPGSATCVDILAQKDTLFDDNLDLPF